MICVFLEKPIEDNPIQGDAKEQTSRWWWDRGVRLQLCTYYTYRPITVAWDRQMWGVLQQIIPPFPPPVVPFKQSQLLRVLVVSILMRDHGGKNP